MGTRPEPWSLSESRELQATDTSMNSMQKLIPYRRLSAKNVKVVRPTLFNYVYTRDEYQRYSKRLWQLLLDHKFKVGIHGTYQLQDIAQAHQVSQLPGYHAHAMSNSAGRT